jgi:hypothetical protein
VLASSIAYFATSSLGRVDLVVPGEYRVGATYSGGDVERDRRARLWPLPITRAPGELPLRRMLLDDDPGLSPAAWTAAPFLPALPADTSLCKRAIARLFVCDGVVTSWSVTPGRSRESGSSW